MLQRANPLLARFCELLAGLGVMVLAILVTATVFLRFVVGSPPHWAEELPRLVLVWTTLVGAVVCSHRRSHLNAGITPLLIRSPRHRRTIEACNDLLLVALFCLLGKAGWDLAQLTMSQTTTALQLPAGILYLAVPVGCAALAVVHLGLLLQRRSAA
jgi:TRAP-type transport system small permease protein